MEKKPKIELPFRTYKDVHGESYIKDAKEQTVCFLKDEKSAVDMVTAVNETIGRGFNPIGVEPLVDSVSSLLNNFTAEEIAQVKKLNPTFYKDFIVPMSKALNNIKYK